MKNFKKILVFSLLMFLLLSLLLPKDTLAATELPNIYSPSAILIDSVTGKVLYEKDSNFFNAFYLLIFFRNWK